MILPDGYSEVPTGRIATVVTCLEMISPPPQRGEPVDAPWRLARIERPEPEWYRDLYRRVGEAWLWYSRLAMPRAELAAILGDPAVAVFALETGGRQEGLLELDFRDGPGCELAFFGLTTRTIGRGAGRWLMNRAIEQAWSRPIDRLWVHTCTLDHPAALTFYIHSGFRPYARRIEIAPDPRLTGITPRSAAPHVPILDPGQVFKQEP
jgi:GNAT superfamily N-acetyltransferase